MEYFIEIAKEAGNQHFVLFPQCFQPYQKRIAVFEPQCFRFGQSLTLSQTSPGFYMSAVQVF